MNKSRIRILDIFMAIILVVGIGIFSYPFVEDSLNDFLAQQMIIHYQKQASNKNSEEIKNSRKNDKENQQLAEQNVSPGIGSFNQAVDAKALKDLPSNAFLWNICLESSKSQKSMSAYLYSIRQRKYFCKRNVIIGRKFLSDWREKHPCRSFWASWTPRSKIIYRFA